MTRQPRQIEQDKLNEPVTELVRINGKFVRVPLQIGRAL